MKKVAPVKARKFLAPAVTGKATPQLKARTGAATSAQTRNSAAPTSAGTTQKTTRAAGTASNKTDKSSNSKIVSATSSTGRTRSASKNAVPSRFVTARRIYYQIFETEFGDCGIVWSADGITNVKLPERTLKELRNRLDELGVLAPEGKEPAFVRRAIKKIQTHLGGKPQRFEDVPIDLTNVPGFHQKVYLALQKVPPGNVTTYGDLAGLAGSPLASRAVGQAMAKNPLSLIVPCHRVLGSAGKLGGFSAHGGLETKLRLLDFEQGKGPR